MVGAKEPTQSSKRLEEGKVVAAVGGGVVASGIYFFFRKAGGPEINVATDRPINSLLAAIAPKAQPENATGVSSIFLSWRGQAPGARARRQEHGQSLTKRNTEITAGMQPMLVEWEKALEAAERAQLQLASFDPAQILESSICSGL